MRKMTIDETLALTALFELDVTFRRMEPEDAADKIRLLLEAWWDQDAETRFWSFTRSWLIRRGDKITPGFRPVENTNPLLGASMGYMHAIRTSNGWDVYRDGVRVAADCTEKHAMEAMADEMTLAWWVRSMVA